MPALARRTRFSRPVDYTILALGLLTGTTAAAPAAAQDTHGWPGPSPFRSLDLPAATTIRTGAGRPGPDYWQQQVDYTLDVAVDTATRVLTGTGTMRYRNNSPEALSFLWLKLDANRCGEESEAAVLNVPPLLFGDAVFDFSCTGGSGMTLEWVASGQRSLEFQVYGTLARVDLPHPLPHGGTADIELAWRWTLPEYGYGRMGRDGSLYQVAQWYPRAAVYDDASGWNIAPFLGAGEFYQEYGDFRVSITVPAGYIVAATGTIDNPESVLTAAQRNRLAQARTSETAVAIVTRAEALRARRTAVRGPKIWRFSARNVRDFGFAMAPDFRWDASSWDGTLIQTFYRPEATLWEEANRMSWVSIKHFSERLAPYPWPHATTVEGPNEGMEYPMITFVPRGSSREELYWVLTHEFGHEWYPMLVNSNERLHPWMDEGFNTFIDIGSVQEYFAGQEYATTIDHQPLDLYPEHALAGQEQAMARPPDEQHDLFWAAYFKPALMLHLLRTEVLGPERFDRAFSEYTKAWSFKHPTPADFFRFMEDASGMQLDWFWRGWIYSTARLDQAVEHVTSEGETAIHLRNRGTMLMPAELELTFADGGKETVRLPVEMWKLGPQFAYRVSNQRVLARVELDPRRVYPDENRENNVWQP
ncbi:MAG: M1 family metallopeptidase [Gemmatimonadales bacterium]|nr:M1 family metallopeptidase [Gemmatimonadales bacterium]